MPLRRLLILLINLSLLLSLSAQALSAAGHPCLGAGDRGAVADGAMDHSAMDHGAMDHGAMDHGAMDHGAMDHGAMDHGAMDHSAMAHSGHGADPAATTVDQGSMACCDGTDDCAMEQCVVMPASLVADPLQLIWLAGSADFISLAGATASASYPPYHPPFFA